MTARYRTRTVRLADGTLLRLRAIEPADRATVAGAFARLSEESRYHRFFLPLQELSPEMLAYLTDVDHVDHEALVAVDPASGQGVAVARYVRSEDDPAAAEVAITVDDAWQGRGVGTLLLDQLAQRARVQGVSRFTALVLAENTGALRLLRSLGDTRTTGDGEVVELLIDLPRRRAATSALARLLRYAASGRLVAGAMIRRAAPHEGAPDQPPPSAAIWPATTLRRVVAGADTSDTGRRAVLAAAQVAAAQVAAGVDASLHLVCSHGLPGNGRAVVTPDLVPPETSDLAWQVMSEADARAVVSELAVELASRFPTVTVDTCVRLGKPASAIAEVAYELQADLIVVGSKGLHTARRLITGSVAGDILRRSPCSVLVVRTDEG